MIKSFLRLSLFRIVSTAVLLTFAASVLVIVIADAAYVDRQSFLEVLQSPDIRAAFLLTLFTSLVTTALCLVVGVLSAYALSRFPLPGNDVVDTFVDLLIILPVLVIGVSLLVVFRMGARLEAADLFLLSSVGSLFSSAGDFFIYTRPGIVLAQFFCSVPFAIRTIKAAFDHIDPRTEQVAMTLGCSRAQAFRRITLPLARQGIVAGGVLAWARAFGLFGPVAIVAGAVRQKTEVLSTSIYLEISIGRLETALSVSLIMFLAAFVILFLMRRLSGGNIFGLGGRP
ncbi:MAG: ABC transporter permease [Fibrobacterota bacterium]